jgi:hypothetical protein
MEVFINFTAKLLIYLYLENTVCLLHWTVVGIEILMAMSMNVTVFLDVTTCSLVDINIFEKRILSRRASFSEILVPIYHTLWHHIPEDYNLID